MVRELPAHKEAVLGVRILPKNSPTGAAFFTWATNGTVLYWTLDGTHKGDFNVELEQPSDLDEDVPNELRVVRVSPQSDYYVSGDRYGVMR